MAIHKPKGNESVWIFSMGKRFAITAICDSVDDANLHCERNKDAAVIAEFGGLVICANRYAGIRPNGELCEVSRG